MKPGTPEYQQHMQQMAQQQAGAQLPQVQVAKIKAETELTKQQAENQREMGKLQVETQEGRVQLVHEAIQNKDQQLHEQMQGHKDREVDLDSNHLQIVLKLIPAIAQVLAAEKRDPKELGPDVAAQAQQVEQPPAQPSERDAHGRHARPAARGDLEHGAPTGGDVIGRQTNQNCA